jgi:UDP-GlcNAc:undecaprenyl-phosphate/decaprenyl-phosphate GlcNAc-1-phosphate transferase
MTLWVVGMINSVNFIDGLDGLLAGVATIAAVTLGINSLLSVPSQPAVALMCALLAGSLLGFLPWNFHPAKVFIGTAGVFMVGYSLAVLSVLGTAKVAVALLVLGVPIIDTFWVITRRLAQGRAPFSADRGHFHHRLLDLGLTHRGAVLLIYGVCAVLAVLSFVLSGRGQLSAFVIIVIGGGLLLYLMTRAAREALQAESYPDEEEPAGPEADTTNQAAPPADGHKGAARSG